MNQYLLLKYMLVLKCLIILFPFWECEVSANTQTIQEEIRTLEKRIIENIEKKYSKIDMNISLKAGYKEAYEDIASGGMFGYIQIDVPILRDTTDKDEKRKKEIQELYNYIAEVKNALKEIEILKEKALYLRTVMKADQTAVNDYYNTLIEIQKRETIILKNMAILRKLAQ